MAADPDLIALFARGWALTRGVAPPVSVSGGHYIHVDQPDQKARYIFPSLDPETLVALAARIDEPFVYLKVCAAPDAVRSALPDRWIIREPPTFMMTAPLRQTVLALPSPYKLEVAANGEMWRAAILYGEQEVARGRIVLLDGTALFDQVGTDEAHRRKGLGRIVMQALANTALEGGVANGLLSATEMGRCLYETIGWSVHAPYTSAVIPI